MEAATDRSSSKRNMESVDDFSKVPANQNSRELARIWSIRYWLDKLSEKKLIDAQIMFHLFVAHAHCAFKYYYQGAAKGSRGESLTPSLDSDYGHQERTEMMCKPCRKRWYQAGSLFKLAPDADQWDWKGVPEWSSSVRLYLKVSLISVIYAFIKSLIGMYPNQVNAATATQSWLIMGWPANCYVLGRFIFQPGLEGHCCKVFSFFHISWRYVMRYRSSSFMLGPLIFLLQTEHDLRKFHQLMNENRHKNYLANLSSPVSLVNREESASGPYSGMMQGNSDFYRQIARQSQQVCDENHRRQRHEIGHEISVHESFFRHIMCYEIHVKDKIYYKLRPNRSWASRDNLIYHLSASTLVALCGFVHLVMIANICVSIFAFSDANYARLYPDCSPELSRKFASAHHHLEDWYNWLSFAQSQSSLHIGAHRLLALVVDLAESVNLWCESVLSIVFVPVLAYLLNQDILIYWRHLHAKLEIIVAKTKQNRDEARSLSLENAHQSPAESVTIWKSTSVARLGDNIVTSARTTRLGDRRAMQLESDINEFQFELIDFFAQVEKADKIVSVVITQALIIWIFNLTYVSYFWIRSMSELPLSVTIIFVVGFVVVTVASQYLLKLHRCCMKSYKLICTLMAYDQASTKKRFLKLLEFYAQRNRTTYTLFQSHPYKATTFLSVAGWSLSGYFVTKSLFSNSRR